MLAAADIAHVNGHGSKTLQVPQILEEPSHSSPRSTSSGFTWKLGPWAHASRMGAAQTGVGTTHQQVS